MKKVLVFLTILVFITACSAEEKSKKSINKNSQIGVVIERASTIRLDPYLYSAKIAELSKGEKVEILGVSKEKASIARMKDFWYHVKSENGLTGWIFGSNIKIFEAGNSSLAEAAEEEIKESELDEITKKMIGKWWSVNTKEEFTSIWISLFKDGKYETQSKTQTKLYKGMYTLNLAKGTISLDNDSPLGKELKFSQRGLNYFIEYADENKNVRFKQISSNPKSVEEVEMVSEKKVETTDTVNVGETDESGRQENKN